MGRRHRFGLLRNDTAAILSADSNVLIHSLVLVVVETVAIVSRLVCFQEKVELLFLHLLGEALDLLLVCGL